MKILASLIAIFSLFGLYELTEDTLSWHNDIESAAKAAKKSKKNMLLYFTGSDWCGPCKALSKDFFESEKFKSHADEFILIKIDIPRRLDIISEKEIEYNKAALTKYNPSKKFPTLIALDHKGKEIDRITSYSGMGDPTSYFNFMDKIQEK